MGEPSTNDQEELEERSPKRPKHDSLPPKPTVLITEPDSLNVADVSPSKATLPTSPAAASPKSAGSAASPTSTKSAIPTPTAFGGLTADQKERLAKAKTYAKEQTAFLLGTHNLGSPLATNSTTPAASSPFLSSATAVGSDARTLITMSRIYVGSISFDLNEAQIKEVFSQFGSVRVVTMSLDPATGKHKGFCFVEFDCPEAADLALSTMHGSDLGGRNLKVGRPNNYNNSIGQTLPPAPPYRVFVANVNENVGEGMVKTIFESFGKVETCVLLPDPITRKHKGCGYIDFAEDTSAASSIAALQSGSFELGGLTLRATKAIIGGPLPEGMKALEKMPKIENPFKSIPSLVAASSTSSGLAGLPPRPIPGVNNSIVHALQHAVQKVQAAVNDESTSLEDNLSISASQRYSIMQKLLRHDEKKVPESPVIRLKNIVTVNEVDDDLSSEISEECSNYGKVLNVIVSIEPSQSQIPDGDVDIYVLFATTEEASKARTALNGRWFGGRKVEAFMEDMVLYNTLVEKKKL
ncbi:Poly(U)-binding-splicing factor puf60 [Phlyctochytrium planicorne]|nr:Poly(U)-binding-splicing factor puf60 [Phlyctochytrium planicorne]